MSLSKGNFRKISVAAMAAVAALTISACAAQAQEVYSWVYTKATGNVNGNGTTGATQTFGTFTVTSGVITAITGQVSTTNGGSSAIQNITALAPATSALLPAGSTYTQPVSPNKTYGPSTNTFVTALAPTGGIQAFDTVQVTGGNSLRGIYFTTDFQSNTGFNDYWFFAYNGTSPGYWTLTDMSTGGGGTGNFAVTLLPEINGEALSRGVLLLTCIFIVVGRRRARSGLSALDPTDA